MVKPYHSHSQENMRCYIKSCTLTVNMKYSNFFKLRNVFWWSSSTIRRSKGTRKIFWGEMWIKPQQLFLRCGSSIQRPRCFSLYLALSNSHPTANSLYCSILTSWSPTSCPLLRQLSSLFQKLLYLSVFLLTLHQQNS